MESGRRALDRWFDYPWYDSKNDRIRRIDVEPPDWSRRPASSSWNPDVSVFHVVMWTFVGLLLLLIVWLLWRFFRDRDGVAGGRTARGAEESDRARIESLPFPVRAGKLDLLEQARRHYQAGNYAQAIIYLYSHQLVRLDRQQIIHLTKGKTNRQYLREVGPGSRLAGLLEDTMVAFEDVYFGQHPLDRIRFEACWSRLDEFETLAAARAPAAA